jgi:hypothetical protein
MVSAAITCHFLLSAGIVARLPALHRRFGLVATTRAGGVLAGLGVATWAAAPLPWMLFPAAVVSGAGWALTSGAAINAMVAPWFDRRRPAAISMAFNGASVGGVLFAPLWAVLIARLGFPLAAVLVGATMAAAVWWIAGAYFRTTPANLGQRPDGDGTAPAGSGAATRPAPAPRAPLPAGAAVWRDRRFLTLSAAFALGLFAQIGLVAHLFSLLAPALGEAGAGLAVSLATACAVLGRTLVGWLLPADADRRVAPALNFAVQVAGCLALLAAGGASVPLLLLGCVLFGLGIGNLTSLPPLIAQSEFLRTDTGRVVALVTATNQAVFAFAPAVLGGLRSAAAVRCRRWRPSLACRTGWCGPGCAGQRAAQRQGAARRRRRPPRSRRCRLRMRQSEPARSSAPRPRRPCRHHVCDRLRRSVRDRLR